MSMRIIVNGNLYSLLVADDISKLMILTYLFSKVIGKINNVLDL
jgi:hypothetical protein